MSKIAVNEITNEAGTGGPTLPNGVAGGLTLGGDLTLDTNGIYLGGTGSANYLDDYEEGTFNPSYVDSDDVIDISYSERTGVYVKIGNIVWIFIGIRVSSTTTAPSGEIRIANLPFVASSSISNVNFNSPFSIKSRFWNNPPQCAVLQQSPLTEIRLLDQINASGNNTNTGGGDWDSGGSNRVSISGMYYID